MELGKGAGSALMHRDLCPRSQLAVHKRETSSLTFCECNQSRYFRRVSVACSIGNVEESAGARW